MMRVEMFGGASVALAAATGSKAAELFPIQPRRIKASIFIGEHDGDCRLWIVHVECPASGNEFHQLGTAVVVVNVKRKGHSV